MADAEFHLGILKDHIRWYEDKKPSQPLTKPPLGKTKGGFFISRFEHDLQDSPINRINREIKKIFVIVFDFQTASGKTKGGFLLSVV
jgi:hypothetical protein